MRSVVKLFSAVVVCLLTLQTCSEPEGSAQSQQLTVVQGFMADPEALARGEALFIGTCADFCHTQAPQETDALYLFDCEWKYGGSDDEIFATVTNGVPDTRMVGFGDNFPEGADDLWKIIAYLRSNQQAC